MPYSEVNVRTKGLDARKKGVRRSLFKYTSCRMCGTELRGVLCLPNLGHSHYDQHFNLCSVQLLRTGTLARYRDVIYESAYERGVAWMIGSIPSTNHLLNVDAHMGTSTVNAWSYAILRLRLLCFLLIETCVSPFCLPAILPFCPSLDRHSSCGMVVGEYGEVVCI
jgi:hypothetical protein